MTPEERVLARAESERLPFDAAQLARLADVAGELLQQTALLADFHDVDAPEDED